MTSYYGTSHIAAYAGVTQTSVKDWWTDHTNNFPVPEVVVVSFGGAESPGWHVDQLPEIRSWVMRRFSQHYETNPWTGTLPELPPSPWTRKVQADREARMRTSDFRDRRRKIDLLMDSVLGGASWEETTLRRSLLDAMRENDSDTQSSTEHRRQRIDLLVDSVLSGSSWEETTLRECLLAEMRDNDLHTKKLLQEQES